ncbi:MAG: DNA-3-methyladenine glycosylase I [Polyangiaceae bacterium]
MPERTRCAWAQSDPLLRAYHDQEWGVVLRDGRALWEALTLEGFQAGLAWITILRKREAFRKSFAQFDPKKVARFQSPEMNRLMKNAGIIRSLPKILAAVGNARAYLAMEEAGEDFSTFVWSFVGEKPLINRSDNVPASTPLSVLISKELKKRGFKFVGPVGVYAWMQAVGMVDDHAATCFRRKKK